MTKPKASNFCKHFFHKTAKAFCRLLHLHFVDNCKTSAEGRGVDNFLDSLK